jgi:hypothetical protein
MLSKSLCEWRLSVTFSADHLLDCIESNSPRPGEGVRPAPHVVLVDAAHADALTQDVRSLAWDGNKEVGFAQNGRERDNLVPAVGGATCLGECW